MKLNELSDRQEPGFDIFHWCVLIATRRWKLNTIVRFVGSVTLFNLLDNLFSFFLSQIPDRKSFGLKTEKLYRGVCDYKNARLSSIKFSLIDAIDLQVKGGLNVSVFLCKSILKLRSLIDFCSFNYLGWIVYSIKKYKNFSALALGYLDM